MQKSGQDKKIIYHHVGEFAYKSNKNAINLFEEGKIESGLNLLERNEVLLKNFDVEELANVQSLTFTNIAYLYKVAGNLQEALKYLNKALDICNFYNEKDDIAAIYLNMSFILRSLKNNKMALECATNSAFQCQEDILRYKENPTQNRNSIVKKTNLLGTAFFNMGLEEESLGNLKVATEWYSKAYNIINNDKEADLKLKSDFYSALKQCQEKMQPLNYSLSTRNTSSKTIRFTSKVKSKNRIPNIRSYLLKTKPRKCIVPISALPKNNLENNTINEELHTNSINNLTLDEKALDTDDNAIYVKDSLMIESTPIKDTDKLEPNISLRQESKESSQINGNPLDVSNIEQANLNDIGALNWSDSESSIDNIQPGDDTNSKTVDDNLKDSENDTKNGEDILEPIAPKMCTILNDMENETNNMEITNEIQGIINKKFVAIRKRKLNLGKRNMETILIKEVMSKHGRYDLIKIMIDKLDPNIIIVKINNERKPIVKKLTDIFTQYQIKTYMNSKSSLKSLLESNIIQLIN